MTVEFSPEPGAMQARLDGIAAFPDSSMKMVIPESIGDAADPAWFDDVDVEWERTGADTWRCVGERDGELSYTGTVTTSADTVDVDLTLTNESARDWDHGFAFTCCNPGPFTPVTDYECVRHWTRSKGAFRRLTGLPRAFSERPTVQLYDVEGAPAATDVPFVERFDATPHVALEPWLAIADDDGERHLAVASSDPLFLFQNMEYSCIHSCPTFGSLAPGESGSARTRVYLVEAGLEELYDRIQSDFEWG